MSTNASLVTPWAEPVPEMGPAVYRLTNGPKEHKHTYHLYCPWSEDGNSILLLRYDFPLPEAEVCLLDSASGEIQPVVKTNSWGSHNCAGQQWQGDRDRIYFHSADERGETAVTVNRAGTDRQEFATDGFPLRFCSPDGRWVYGATPLESMFPNDDIAPRNDKGVIRLNLDTGERELVMSLEQVLELVPEPGKIADCHLFAKMVILHKRFPRLLFGVVNGYWARAGLEPRIKFLMSVGTDGADPAYIGNYAHHPNWHSSKDIILSNIKDFNENMRFGLFDGHGRGLPEYIPGVKGSGHPSYSPDGEWICTDAGGPEGNRIIICDPAGGPETIVMESDFRSGGYATFKAVDERGPGESVMEALRGIGEKKTRQTQAHPAWSRDASAILFNGDTGNGSQLYMVDVKEALKSGRSAQDCR